MMLAQLRTFGAKFARHSGVAACIVLTGAIGLRIADAPLLQAARLAVFDAYQQTKPREYKAAPVRVIDIDEETLARHGQWPWPRRKMAHLINRLSAHGAAAIGLDIVFAEPDRTSPIQLLPSLKADGLIAETASAETPWPDYDAELAAAFSKARVVSSFGLHGKANAANPALRAGIAIIGDDPVNSLHQYAGAVTNLPGLEAAAIGNGSFSVVSETDKVIRRVPLLAVLHGKIYPSLIVEMLRVAQGADTIGIRSKSAAQGMGGPASVNTLRVGRVKVPVERDGQTWVHYSESVPARTIPAWKIMAGDGVNAELLPRLRGNLVLVGFSAVGLVDLRSTPLNPFEPGVNIHAQVLEQIIQGEGLSRPAWTSPIELGAAAILALIAVWVIAKRGPRWGGAAVLIAIAGLLGGSWYAYAEEQWLVDATFPVLAVLLSAGIAGAIAFARTEREKGQIRSAFGQYLSPQLVNQLADDPGSLKLGGEYREMTFLFTDLQGFTSMTEGMAPDVLVRTLNGYLDGMCSIVMDHGGAVDKIVGDAVHAMFNAPVEMPDHQAQAVKCALAMDEFAEAFVAKMAEEGVALGVTRIGVNTGRVIVGNFGGNQRFDYTAHGDAINTAARLEAANKQLGTRICVAGTTVVGCEDIRFRPIGSLMLRGKTIGVPTFEPIPEQAFNDDELKAYREAYENLPSDAAAATITALASKHQDDPLLKLHAKRIEDGKSGAEIMIA
jgi:adenylate cyclase